MKICIKCQLPRKVSDFYKRESGLRAECKICFNADRAEYYQNNKDVVLSRNKKYVENNKNSVNAYKSKWQKENSERRRIKLNERYKTEPNFRIAVNLRSRILKALDNNQKKGSTLDLLGCSIDFFREYIKAKFVVGMSWNNHGNVWHIDHIKPCSKFDLSKESQQRKCFHYTNMQPLFVYDNLSKGNRI